MLLAHTCKMKRIPLNCGLFVDKVYLMLHENGHELKKYFPRNHKHIRPEAQASLKYVTDTLSQTEIPYEISRFSLRPINGGIILIYPLADYIL